MTPGDGFFEAVTDEGSDPAAVRERAELAARLLVRGAHDSADAAVAERLVHLAETEGLETLAELWAGAPVDTVAGCLWRLYLLRSWVYADPAGVAEGLPDDAGGGAPRGCVAPVGPRPPRGGDQDPASISAATVGGVMKTPPPASTWKHCSITDRPSTPAPSSGIVMGTVSDPGSVPASTRKNGTPRKNGPFQVGE